MAALGEASASNVAAGILAACPTTMASTTLGSYATGAAPVYRCCGIAYRRCGGGEWSWHGAVWPGRRGTCSSGCIGDLAAGPASVGRVACTLGVSVGIHESRHEWARSACPRSSLNTPFSEPHGSHCFVDTITFVSVDMGNAIGRSRSVGR